MLSIHSILNSTDFSCRLTPNWVCACLGLWHWTFPNPTVPCGSWVMYLLENIIQSLMLKTIELDLLLPKIRPVFLLIKFFLWTWWF